VPAKVAQRLLVLPLAYSALNANATTALAGVGASYKVIPTVTTLASAGVEQTSLLAMALTALQA